MVEYKYKAFISYSHKDQKWASWLHRRLETYSFPKAAIGQSTPVGPVPKNLKPVFRDRDELAAADNLGDKIETALEASENLIIICSPDAARSHWVNQEILYFKRHNRGAKIFSVIVDGEPFADGKPEMIECLPEALRFQVGEDGDLTNQPAEPLAADLRPEGDGKRLGTLKLISGMAGLGLDDLVQRDLARARSRVMAITTGALATVLAMGTLTWFAMDARQEAEARTDSAEELIEFMVTDLRNKLEPVGRLDTLDDVALKVIDYYDDHRNRKRECKTSMRHASALHFAASKSYDGNNNQKFLNFSKSAYQVTTQLMQDCISDAEVIISHANSLYYLGLSKLNEQGNDAFRETTFERQRLIESYCEKKPDSDDCNKNLAYIYIEKGVQELRSDSNNLDKTLVLFEKAKSHYEATSEYKNNKFKIMKNHAEVFGWIGETYFKHDKYQVANSYFKRELNGYKEVLKSRKSDFENSELTLMTYIESTRSRLARTLVMRQNFDEAIRLADDVLDRLDSLIEINPSYHFLYRAKIRSLVFQAVAHRKLGNSAQACGIFNEATGIIGKQGLEYSALEKAMKSVDTELLTLC